MRNVSLLLGLAAIAAACTPSVRTGSPAGTTTVSTADTILGVVNEVGSDPATWLAIQPRGGGASVRLEGDGTTGLRGVTGAEVWVSGARQSGGFRVDLFEVRRVDGNPVDDGVISVESGKVMVRMRSGTQREVLNPPTALRNMPGARVWISLAVADRAPSYGVIRRP